MGKTWRGCAERGNWGGPVRSYVDAQLQCYTILLRVEGLNSLINAREVCPMQCKNNCVEIWYKKDHQISVLMRVFWLGDSVPYV